MVVISFETLGAGMHVVEYLKFFFNAIFKLLDSAGQLVSLCEVVSVPLLEGDHQPAYDSSEHVGGKPSKAVSGDLH